MHIIYIYTYLLPDPAKFYVIFCRVSKRGHVVSHGPEACKSASTCRRELQCVDHFDHLHQTHLVVSDFQKQSK